MDKNTILERLMKGEDPQVIANEFADMLNEANKEYTEKQSEVQMKEELQGILDLFVEWLDKYYEFDVEVKITADQALEVIDSVKDLTTELKGLENLFAETSKVTPDDTINNFLKLMKW